ncbi:MAG: phytoene/squalene synthase family protein [Pirellulaceae bacterium]
MSNSMGMSNAALNTSYRWCADICRKSGSSFIGSFIWLDRPRRRAMQALYAFARITDDFSDCDESTEARRAKLQVWSKQLHAAIAGDPFSNEAISLSQFAALWPALVDSVRRYAIPESTLQDIVSGVMMDLDHQPPVDWAELRHYCYHVASAVGLACTHIWLDQSKREQNVASGAQGPSGTLRQAAIDCGIAFQLTNILRDVAEDARQGRVYIPRSVLAAHQVELSPWLAGEPSGDWHAALEEVAEEARTLYVQGWTTIDYLTPRSRRVFALMWRSYRRLLDRAMHERHAIWQGHKPCLRWTDKIQLMAGSMWAR